MKKTLILCFVILTVVTVTQNVRASLVDNLDGTITQTFESGLELMWLQDTTLSGLMTYDEAVQWVENLEYAGYNDWRLPSLPGPNNPINHFDYDGELGILYFNELGNDTLPFYVTPTITGPFLGIAPDTNCYYWYDLTIDNFVSPSGETYDAAYTLDTAQGTAGVQNRINLNYVWAVRDGQSGSNVTVKVISPDGGETLIKDNEYRIKWSWSHYSGYIRIHAYLNNQYFYTIASSERVKNGKKGVVFNPPGNWPNSDYYKIHISTLDDVASDESDDYFTITDVIPPNFPLDSAYMDQSHLPSTFCDPTYPFGEHKGIDISVPAGRPVYAVCKGNLIYDTTDSKKYKDNYSQYWNGVMIMEYNCNGEKVYGHYGHVKSTLIKNSTVEVNEPIGFIREAYDQAGNRNPSNDHLHFGLNVDQAVRSAWGIAPDGTPCQTLINEGWTDPITYFNWPLQ